MLLPVSATLPSKSSSSANASYYTKARANLGRDWYVIYTIVDRISRSNNLDKYSWRIVLTDEYEIQAYSSEENRITIPRGVLDIANSGDTSALACIIGHEIAHHTLEHRAKIPANYFQMKNDLLRQLDEKISASEKLKKQREDTINQYRENLKQPNQPSWLKSLNQIGLGLALALPEPNPIDPEKLRQEAGNQLDAQHYSNLRSQELEADREGFAYAIRAGFDKDGCMNLFDILARRSSGRIDRYDSGHPPVEVRKNQILQLISTDSLRQLIQEGRSNRSGKKPLTYELNKGLGWLRVNTRMGNAQADFDRLFKEDK